MTRCWLAVIVLGLLVGHLAADDQAKLEGSWLAIAAERNGQAADDVKGHVVVFKGDRFTIFGPDGKQLYEGTWRIDAKKQPSQIDFVHTGGVAKGKTWLGIYTAEGDTLKICDNAPDLAKPRPTSFVTRADSGAVCVTLQRKKS